MLLTHDQRFLLSALRETGYMRRDQILPLMRLYDPIKEERHCEAILRHLRYAGELIPVGEELVCLPELRQRRPDGAMLRALEDGRMDLFGVLPVEPGREQISCILLSQQPGDMTVLFDLTDLEQHRLLRIPQRHYFVVRQKGRLRFFKGGDAGK